MFSANRGTPQYFSPFKYKRSLMCFQFRWENPSWNSWNRTGMAMADRCNPCHRHQHPPVEPPSAAEIWPFAVSGVTAAGIGITKDEVYTLYIMYTRSIYIYMYTYIQYSYCVCVSWVLPFRHAIPSIGRISHAGPNAGPNFWELPKLIFPLPGGYGSKLADEWIRILTL